MYKTKPRFRCNMPSDAPLNVLALNASLKHEPTLSNTGELVSLVLDEMRALAAINVKLVRLSDATLPVGLRFREAAEDDWPDLVMQIKAADIVLFCTPIWWAVVQASCSALSSDSMHSTRSTAPPAAALSRERSPGSSSPVARMAHSA
jgi:hypothetical protein